MPIYEYTCRACRHAFEELVLGREEAPACPACSAAGVERQPSVFAAHGERAPAPRVPATGLGPCGTCGDPRGPGACSA